MQPNLQTNTLQAFSLLFELALNMGRIQRPDLAYTYPVNPVKPLSSTDCHPVDRNLRL